ncbi:LysE family translocator [Phaeobacter gallaeciensis]|uniref:LysE type translocator n=1 Tax=Phaeobacter gallaeciensis TaxID=60890 RepID=A0AAD0EB70_9RHOB|nr:LysE family translocator [Phaeobacter gallaeciensis]AHD07814.1 Putative threonine efflux protein [Phaeobacter gallaeciensis DSM 26640]ATE91082.1 putative LysE type translocator [Phaeobacter gallaeciensis]ATE95357.1 putative LysE type translocator [Phaeobacter gallaeciensis]ATE99696.1 putative LysE type translocator [Phaeobacter gallaeciensis]ATF04129.1 putative LysE type translocator [Phaeobacter gallaeciensis]
MSVSVWDLTLYAGGLFVLFLTPGPVWLAVMARAMSGGFPAAWPLALGVACGDILWPLVAVAGVSWIVSEVTGLMEVLRWFASAMFLFMGVMLLRHADARIEANSALTRPGLWAGFIAGIAVILGNPKAILFYMGVLPGFFDLTAVTRLDILAIVVLSFLVPLVGNLCMAGMVHRVRWHITSPATLRRINIVSGCLLIGVGCLIPFV